MEFSLGDKVSNVGGAGVGDGGALDPHLLLEDVSQVLVVQLADLPSGDVVAVVLEVDEEVLLPSSGRVGRGRGVLGSRLGAFAGGEEEGSKVGCSPAAFDEAAE